jgi:hypothetical protein
MNRTVISLVVALSFGLVWLGCTGSGGGGKSAKPSKTQASHKQKPGWARKGTTDFSKGDRTFLVGCTSQHMAQDQARGGALRAAIEALAHKVGVKVEATSELKEELHNGKTMVDVTFHSKLSAVPFKVKELRSEGFYWEEWNRQGALSYDACVLVSLPTENIKVARRMAKGAVMVAWNCSADKKAECSKRLLDPVRALVSKLGSKLLPTVKNSENSENACPLGVRHDAAFVLFIDLDAKFHSEVHGEFYAYADANADLVDTSECTSKAFEIERQKGGHFNAKAAVGAAMKKAVDELAAELEYRLQ